MSKKEIIWRFILCEALDKRISRFSRKEIAKKFSFSTSTVFNALKIPRSTYAIEVSGRSFRLRDPEKLLTIWATHRNLARDIIYKTYVKATPPQLEGFLPPEIIFGGFSAYRLRYNSVPTDYGEVYVYSSNLDEIKKRFPPQTKKRTHYHNFFFLQADPYLASFGYTTPNPQTYVDLWNIPQWYAKDFLIALKEKMNL